MKFRKITIMFIFTLILFVMTTANAGAITVREAKERASDIRTELSELRDEKELYLKYSSIADKISIKLHKLGIDKDKDIDELTYRIIGKTLNTEDDLDARIAELEAELEVELAKYSKFERMEFIGDYKLTGYCPCYGCSGGWGTRTASGVKATEGITVAADKRKIPLGTKIYIEGVGERIVQDVGGAIKGNKIDIFVNRHQDCYKDCYNMKTQVYIIHE